MKTPVPQLALLLVALLYLPSCSTSADATDEEFYFAKAAGEKSLALSYLKRAQFARKKQVEYLELAETQEALLRDLRAELARLRADNNKRAQQIQGLKTESANLAKALKAATDAKAQVAAKTRALQEEKKALEGGISGLKAEIAALKKQQKALEDEKRQLMEALGIEPAEKKEDREP